MGEPILEIRMTRPVFPILMFIGALAFFAGAVFLPEQPLFLRLMTFGSGIIFLLVLPDIRAFYGTEGIKLTFGIGGIWKKKIRRDDVTRISIIEFNPMRDFSGWGIKSGRGRFSDTLMWAMPTKGNRGMLVEMSNGRKVLIAHADLDAAFAALSSFYPVLKNEEPYSQA